MKHGPGHPARCLVTESSYVTGPFTFLIHASPIVAVALAMAAAAASAQDLTGREGNVGAAFRTWRSPSRHCSPLTAPK